MIDSIRQTLNRLRAFFRTERLDRDVEAEMAAHLELAIEENVRRGMPAEEARRPVSLVIHWARIQPSSSIRCSAG